MDVPSSGSLFLCEYLSSTDDKFELFSNGYNQLQSHSN